MARVLITRISSFGDVAMLVPVVFSVAAKYPQDRFIVLTRKSFAPLFENLGFNINAKTFDPQRHGGTFGIFKLLKSITRYGYTHVADVHDVLRTKVIRSWMSLLGKEVAHIDKGRKEKHHMIATKQTSPALKPTAERYMEVFESLGFYADITFKNFFEFDKKSLYPLRAVITEKTGKWVGIAPFSKHREKIYPLERLEKVVSGLCNTPGVTVFLFGSGSKEREILDKWESQFAQAIGVSGKLNLKNELLLISYLDVMLSMDSANMHLASLVQTPVVSVWGATHPSLGFYGFNQDINNAIQVDLTCRPCSVYGEVPCARGDYACLNKITERRILDKIDSVLSASDQSIVSN